MSTLLVSSAAELSAALNTAQAGDEILLASGDYGTFNFDGYTYSDYVTVRSADGDRGATFASITIRGSSHIRIDGVHVDHPSNGSAGSKIVNISEGSSHIDFLNSEVNGLVDNEYQGHYGLYAKNATNVRFEGNDIHDVQNGIVSFVTTELVVSENTLDYIGADGMKFAGVYGALIENNFGPEYVFRAPDAHLDFIQFQGSSSDITIRGNVVLPQMLYTAQGIFMADGVYDNILIENNIIYNGLIRGISVSAGSNIVVQNNTTFTIPGEGHKASIISLPPGSVSQNNIVGFYEARDSGSNLHIQWDDPNDAYYYDDVFVNASKGVGITLEDLRPVEGGPADFGSGLGAEARLRELLEDVGTRPVAMDDAATLDEDATITLDLLANDSDPDGTALELVDVGTPLNGTVVINADGTVTYMPDPDFFGEDSFSYTIRNASGATQTGRVNLVVSGLDDDAPVAEFDLASVLQGGELVIDVLANDADPDGGALTLVSHTGVSKGMLVDLGGGQFSYRANDDATGTDTFSYTIRDASGATATATVTVNIQELGAIPSPVFTAFAAGAPGSTAPQVIDHAPAFLLDEGTLELAFTADALSARQGLFSKDSGGFDNGGHVTVLLEQDDLVVRLQSMTENYELRVASVISAGQEHHVALSFGSGGMQVYLDGELAGSNGHTGGLVGNEEPIVIGASQWASGNEVADLIQDPLSGTVTTANLYDQQLDQSQIAYLSEPGSTPVEDPNTAPLGMDDVAETDQDLAVVIDVLANDSDADGDVLGVQSVGSAANGTVELNADGTLTYTPDAGFFGVDGFTYEVSDGDLASMAAVSVTVNEAGEPEPPIGGIVVATAIELSSALSSAQAGDEILLASGDYGTFNFDGYTYSDYVTVRSADGDRGAVFDAITIKGSSHIRIDGVHVDNPSNGHATSKLVDVSDGSSHIEFLNSEVNGLVDGNYRGHYGLYAKNATDVRFEGNDIHDVQNGIVNFGINGLVVSENTLDYIGIDGMKFGGITNGLIENNTGPKYFFPTENAHVDFIQFQGDGTSVVLRGNVMLMPELADYPNKVVQGLFLKDGVFNDILIEDNLVYTNTVNGIYIQSDAGTGGNVTIRENTVLTPPDVTKWGNAEIRVVSLSGDYLVENNIVDRVVDSVGTGTVRNNLQLQWENPSAPNYYNDAYVNAAVGSSATIEDFQPVSGGPADFGSGMGAEERLQEILSGDVVAPNEAPVAVDDTATGDFGTTITIDVLANDSDADGDALAVQSVGPAANGTVEINMDGTVEYTPDAGFFGLSSFDYVVSDSAGNSDIGTVTVEVVDPLPATVFERSGITDFGGTNADVINLPPAEALQISEGTITFSFSTADASDRQGLFSIDARNFDGTGDHISIYVDKDQVKARFQDGTSSAFLKSGSIVADQEYEVWATFGSDGAELYIDGILVDERDSIATDLSQNPEYLQIGGLGWNSKTGADNFRDPLEGTITDLRVFDEILTPDHLDLV